MTVCRNVYAEKNPGEGAVEICPGGGRGGAAALSDVSMSTYHAI